MHCLVGVSLVRSVQGGQTDESPTKKIALRKAVENTCAVSVDAFCPDLINIVYCQSGHPDIKYQAYIIFRKANSSRGFEGYDWFMESTENVIIHYSGKHYEYLIECLHTRFTI